MATPRIRKKNLEERIRKRIKEKHIELTEKIGKDDPRKAGVMASRLDLCYILMHKEIAWDMRELSKNPELTIGFVLDHLEFDWDWHELTKTLTRGDNFSAIEDHPDLEWDWGFLSKGFYRNTPWELISKLFHKPWDLGKLSERLDFDFDLLDDHPDENWDFHELSRAKYFDLEVLKRHPDLDWLWSEMNESVKFKWDMVREFPDKNWSWSYLRYGNNYKIRKIPHDIYLKHGHKMFLTHDQIVGNVLWKGADEEEVLEKVPFKVAIQILPLALDRVYELIDKYDCVDDIDNIDVFAGPGGSWRKKMLIAEENGKEKAAFKIQWWWKGILEDPNHPKGWEYQERKIKNLLHEN